MDWNGKPYHSLDFELKSRFGQKVYKLALDGHMSCPNRDGTLGKHGCIFCSEGGSGDFAVPLNVPALQTNSITPAASLPPNWQSAITEAVNQQIEAAIARIRGKMGNAPDAYIAYFQSYTNTYAPLAYLEALFRAAIRHPKVVALSIGTRPDCLPDEVIQLCSRLNQEKPVWIELGLQTIHEDTASFIRRGYPLSTFTDALHRLRAQNLETIVHVILGLPGEDRTRMLETVQYLAKTDIQGIKLQLLHVLKGTDLATVYEKAPFPVMTMEAYLDLVIDCIALLPPELVIHRITGDGPKSLLIAPLWSANKRLVLNSLTRRFQERGVTQGCGLTIPSASTDTPNEIPSKY